MDFLLTYVLQVNLLLVIVYLGYTLLLKNLTFYQINRAYFILGIGFSFLYPFLDIRALFRQHVEPMGEVIYSIPELFFVEQSEGTSVFTLNNLLLVVFAVGAGVFVIRLLVQLLSLLRIHLKSEPAVWKSFIYRNVLFPIVPFSFFNKIYINKQQHEERELLDIFKHEDIHVKGRHTFDILFTEIVFITCWYNPVVWLMRKAVRQNLEFLTDQQVLDKGVDRQVYQYSLLNVSKQGANAAIANQFNFKMLKRRIMMMNKKRSSKLELSKYVFLIPVFVLVAGAFTVSKADETIIEVVGYAKSTDIAKVLQKPEIVKEPVEDMEGEDEVKTGPKNKVDSVLGFMLDGEMVTQGEIKALDVDDIEQIVVNRNNELAEKHGFLNIMNVTTKKFADTEGTSSKIKSLTFNNDGKAIGFHVDGPIIHKGKPDNQTILSATSHYESFKKDTSKLGEKSTFSGEMSYMPSRPNNNIGDILKHGARYSQTVKVHYEPTKKDTSEIVVTGYGLKAEKDTSKQLSGRATGVRIRNVTGVMVDSLGNESKPLIIIDGEPLPKGFDLSTVDPNEISSISVLKDVSGTALYGDEGKEGVILITTKVKGAPSKTSDSKLTEVVVTGYPTKSKKKPLIIVNGKPADIDLNAVDLDKVESMTPQKGKEVEAVYGEKAKDGVIYIITKDGEDLTSVVTSKSVREIVVVGRKL